MWRSGDKRGGKAAFHMLSAFAARQRLVLGQVKVAEKSNEIVAIPKLLEMMAIEGTISTLNRPGIAGILPLLLIQRRRVRKGYLNLSYGILAQICINYQKS